MLLVVVPIASAQTSCATLDAPPTGIARPGDALRPGHLGRQVGDVEDIMHFYHDLIGFELRGTRDQPRPFFGNRGLQEVASLVQGAPDPYAQVSRVALLPIPGTSAAPGDPEMTIESIEIQGIAKQPFHPLLTDPGASYLKIIVADLDKTLKLLTAEQPSLHHSLLEIPLEFFLEPYAGMTGKIRAVFVRDPDGYPVELIEQTPAPPTTAAPGSNVLGARVAVIVNNIDDTCHMYESLVGPDFKFWVSPSLMGDKTYQDLTGIAGQFRLAEAMVPGLPRCDGVDPQYAHHGKHFARPHFQDPGAAHFLFMSKDDDVMIAASKQPACTPRARPTRRFSSLPRRACSSSAIRRASGSSSWTTA